jgi:hypothetical protein
MKRIRTFKEEHQDFAGRTQERQTLGAFASLREQKRSKYEVNPCQ